MHALRRWPMAGWLAGMAGAGRLRCRKKKKRVEEGKEEEEV